MGPPGLKATWLRKVEKAYSDAGKEDHLIQFYCYSSEETPGNDLSAKARKADRGKFNQHVEGTRGFIDKNGNEEDTFVDAGNGTAKDVFLISNQVLKNFLKLYQENTTKKSLLTFGVVFMDEFHKHKGSDDTDTIPFQVVEQVSENASHPVSLFPTCGTPVEEGPSAWRAPAKHYLSQWEFFRPENKCTYSLGCGVVRPEKVLNQQENIRKLHKSLAQGFGDGSFGKSEIKRDTDQTRKYSSPFSKTLRQSQPWRGQILNRLPACTNVDIKITPVDDLDTKQARYNLLVSINTLIQNELQTRKKVWRKQKNEAARQGAIFLQDEPTHYDVASSRASNETRDSSISQ
jgi:hypothetical protein